MKNIKKKIYLQVLFILSIAVILSALFIEYVLGFKPCNLCIIERIPYGLGIIILSLNYSFKEKQEFFSILLILIFSFSILISVYHFSIEQGFINESALCETNNLNLITKEDILNSLNKFKVSCKNVAFKIFGLSLTSYNILLSVFMLLLSIKIYKTKYDIKK